jgi:hypothetical protein
VDLSSTCSISSATHCIYRIPHVVSAVGVGEEGGVLTAQLEVVEREWEVGGGFELELLDLARYLLDP